MNESAWFLLGSPTAQVKKLVEVSPELDISLTRWAQNPTDENRPVTLLASQAQIMPRFVALPGEHEIRTLIFLEDNDVIAQRAVELAEKHKEVDLTTAELLKISTWLDSNCQYYGSYWGRRHVKYRNDPGYRPNVTFEQAISTTPPE